MTFLKDKRANDNKKSKKENKQTNKQKKKPHNFERPNANENKLFFCLEKKRIRHYFSIGGRGNNGTSG
jgi:hypothetical protein